MDFSPIELVGYLGSFFIIVSMTRTSILHLRLIGLAGSVTFLVYSALIAAYPIAVVNVVIIGVHLFFLRQLLSKKTEFFSSLELHKNSQYLARFLDFHRDDIEAFQPGFEFEARDDQLRAFILRDMVPAGVFIGRTCGGAPIPRLQGVRVPLFGPVGDLLAQDSATHLGPARQRRPCELLRGSRVPANTGGGHPSTDGRSRQSRELSESPRISDIRTAIFP